MSGFDVDSDGRLVLKELLRGVMNEKAFEDAKMAEGGAAVVGACDDGDVYVWEMATRELRDILRGGGQTEKVQALAVRFE